MVDIKTLHTLWVVGANIFQERYTLLSLFPQLSTIYLFEPLPQLSNALIKYCSDDPRIQIFRVALSERDGEADFFVSNNLASSSLLHFSGHLKAFPHVYHASTIRVNVTTIHALMTLEHLIPPDILFIDAQGAELFILRGVSDSVRKQISVIYLEASEEELYAGSGTLYDIRDFLERHFDFIGFVPFPSAPVHGNALFLNRSRSRLNTYGV